MGRFHDYRFPAESDAYREARDKLLEQEIALRRQVEALAEQRRALPPGGALKEDYAFADAGSGETTRLSQLFSTGKDVLVADGVPESRVEAVFAALASATRK